MSLPCRCAVIDGFDTAAFVAATLAEDMGAGGDVTSAAVIPANARLTAVMDSRDPVTVAGLPLAAAFFRALDPDCSITMLASDGDAVPAGADLMRIEGNARALLTAERSALNTVQHLTGIATMTRQYVDAIAGTGAILLDTRKTLPGLRFAQKYAVVAGGGANHRMGLYDMVLIKENHIAAAGGLREAVLAARQRFPGVPAQVEVETEAQLAEALDAGARLILLDNFSVERMAAAVRTTAGRAELEASGGITLDTIAAIAATGVDRISVGSLTKDVRALDLSMRFEDSPIAAT